jgi:hypothetical protein
VSSELAVALDAVIVAVSDEEPRVLVRGPDDALPAGPFDPAEDRTLEVGLRRWVVEQTQLRLGHVEQLYTFGDRDRDPRRAHGPRMLSIAYLAFVRESTPAGPARWRGWYDYFPWEDWRAGRPALVDAAILPAVDAWVAGASGEERRARERRARRCTGTRRAAWNPELVLDDSASRLVTLENDDVLDMSIGVSRLPVIAVDFSYAHDPNQPHPVCDPPVVPPAPSTSDRYIIH